MLKTGRAGGQTGPVVSRALQALSAFSLDHPAMTLSEIARRSDLPVATAYRFLRELEAWGAVTRDSHGVYRIGLKLWQIGMLCPRTEGLREIALPYLEDLAQLTRENVQLAVREGTEVVFVERIAGTTAVPVLTRVGANFSPTTTSVGVMLLAHAPRDIQEAVLAAPIKKYTEKTVTDAAEIRKEFARAKIQGFVIADRQISMETLSVCAPIHDATGTVIAALSLVVASDGANAHALTPLVRTSAKAISRALLTA